MRVAPFNLSHSTYHIYRMKKIRTFSRYYSPPIISYFLSHFSFRSQFLLHSEKHTPIAIYTTFIHYLEKEGKTNVEIIVSS